MENKELRVGVVFWEQDDEIGSMITETLEIFQCRTINFFYNKKLPEALDAVLVYGPLGSLVPLVNQLLACPLSERPLFILWMTEQFPNPELPEWIRHSFGIMRSRIERLVFRKNIQGEWRVIPNLRWVTRKMNRFRYLGDLYWLQEKGILSILAIASPWTVNHLKNRGFNPIEAYPGLCQECGSNLSIERDIPVLWIGKPGSSRRANILKYIREELSKRNIELLMIDGIENPYVFGEQRTHLLNRTKIVLNILRQTWDDNSLRFCFAAMNRALIISEPTLRHTPFMPGEHLIELDVEHIADGISYFLSHEDERQIIVNHAHKLVSSKMTMHQGIKNIIDQVNEIKFLSK